MKQHPRLSFALAMILVAACGSPVPTSGPGGTTAPSLVAASTPTAAAVATTLVSPASVLFSVDYPSQGSTVTASPVAVGGHAPPGARVVQDISFGFDEEAIADAGGQWQILVTLDEGVNELTFRLGDDEASAIRLALTYSAGPAPVVTLPPATALPPVIPPPPTEPPPVFRTFGDGTWEVGVDIKAGTYRLREPAFFCYWARLRGFDGSLGDIIANENLADAFGVVTIRSGDAGFESSGCDEWSSDLSRVTEDKSHIDVDGTYIVGTDIAAGKWRSSGGDGYCYWARLSAFTGTLNAIIANDLADGRTIVTIRSTDKGFKTSGCGTWTRQ